MAIEDILRALDEQSNAESEAVLEEAREHAKLIIEEGKREAQNIHEGFARQIERVASAESAKKINAARLEAKMIVSSVKGGGVASVFDSARGKLSGVRDARYEALFATLAAEAFAGLEGPVAVRVASQDGQLAQKAAATAGLQATVEATLETSGGLVVEANGGRIVRRNTLEDRLDRSRQFVQADVARVLFS
jgi:vacuolar-type H+-ATPase subunit E/Vma4